MTGLKPDGLEMAEAIRVAMGRAGVVPDDDRLRQRARFGHQAERPARDRRVQGAASGAHAYEIPMSSIKSMVGHSLGAIGAIEIAACALAIEHDVVPPTANLREPDPECDLDYVPLTAREAAAATSC